MSFQLPVLRMNHEEHVREACAKVGAISVVVSGQVNNQQFCRFFYIKTFKFRCFFWRAPGGLGGVDIHALWAVELNHCLSRNIRQPNWHHRLQNLSWKNPF